LSEDIDPRLRAIALGLEWFIAKKLKKNMTITCIGRTKKENDACGGHIYSAHIIRENEWIRAFDMRSRDYSAEEIEAITDYLDSCWNGNGYFLNVVATSHGTGPHIHLNIRYKYRIKRLLNEPDD